MSTTKTLSKLNEIKWINRREAEYRGFTISKNAFKWDVRGSADVDGLRDGSYVLLEHIIKDIDNLKDN